MKTAILYFLLLAQTANAQIFGGESGLEVSENEILARVKPGAVLILSEMHGYAPHHQNQRDMLVKLSPAKFPVSVGMEFFSYPSQADVDLYVSNSIAEEDFLKRVKWGSIDFANYRFQVRFPFYYGGQTLALNMPREITAKISKSGFDSLSPEELKLLPPQFTLGNEGYFARFKEIMGEHVPPEKLQNYFVAQSLWDDTMAWKAEQFLQAHPEHLLVIIVGDFHVSYGGGLPDRLRARGIKNVLSVSQVTDLSEIKSHPTYGKRADFVWVSKE